jgi:hypothetical protein
MNARSRAASDDNSSRPCPESGRAWSCGVRPKRCRTLTGQRFSVAQRSVRSLTNALDLSGDLPGGATGGAHAASQTVGVDVPVRLAHSVASQFFYEHGHGSSPDLGFGVVPSGIGEVTAYVTETAVGQEVPGTNGLCDGGHAATFRGRPRGRLRAMTTP